MTGRLPLFQRDSVSVAGSRYGQEHLHSRFEEFVQTVHALHELQGDARDEQFLQLLDHEAAGVEPYDQSGEEAARGNHDVEHVPPVGTVTRPAEAEETDENVDAVHDGDKDKEVVCTGTRVNIAQVEAGLELTAELVKGVLRRECLSHESDDVQRVQYGHHPRPPTMLVNGAVITPLTDAPSRPLLGTLRRTLPLDQLLQVDPFSLRLGEQSGACLGREVADDDTALIVSTAVCKELV